MFHARLLVPVLLLTGLVSGCTSIYYVRFEKEFSREDSRIHQTSGLTIHGYETTNGDEVDEEGCLKFEGEELLFYPYSDPEFRPRILHIGEIDYIRMEKLNPVTTAVGVVVGAAGVVVLGAILATDSD